VSHFLTACCFVMMTTDAHPSFLDGVTDGIHFEPNGSHGEAIIQSVVFQALFSARKD
jgi:hypothetical protein